MGHDSRNPLKNLLTVGWRAHYMHCMFSSPSLFPHLLKPIPPWLPQPDVPTIFPNYLKTPAILGKGGVFLLRSCKEVLQTHLDLGCLFNAICLQSVESAVNLRSLIPSPKVTETFSWIHKLSHSCSLPPQPPLTSCQKHSDHACEIGKWSSEDPCFCFRKVQIN